MRFLVSLLCVVNALSGCGGYSISGNTVTFEKCSENGCTNTTVKEADPKSFKSLKGDFGKDRHHVFFGAIIVPDADPQTFEVLSDTYGKDRARAYFKAEPISGADAGSFAALNDLNYARDKNDIYILGSPIGACDASSFRWLKDDWQVDGKCAYRRGTKLQDAQASSFVVINFWYAKDAGHVYSSVSKKAIEGADTASFALAEGTCEVCARDKNRCYRMGERSACNFPK